MAHPVGYISLNVKLVNRAKYTAFNWRIVFSLTYPIISQILFNVYSKAKRFLKFL